MPAGYTRDMSEEPRKKGEPEIKKPEPEVKKPEEEVKKPEEEIKKPEVEVKKPEEEVKKPEVEEKKPEVEEKKPEVEEKKPEKVSVNVQDRINRMYARLQQSRAQTSSAQEALAKIKPTAEEGEEGEIKPGLTAQEAEAIWDRKQKEKSFKESETRVLLRHSDALNEDGSFNMNSEFTKSYINIGKLNPMLAYMETGPELAEAMVEKQAGSGYKEGQKAEVNRSKAVEGAHTGASTVAVSTAEVAKISGVEHRIAARMGLTDKEYLTEKEKISKGQKSI